jgi:hypothetical protein
MPSREREFLAQLFGCASSEQKPEISSPALATYDRAAMGTLPTQRGGGMAGIAPQDSGYRGDQVQADDPGPARESVDRPTRLLHVHAPVT